MLIGVPKEIKKSEYRISISPSGVRELTHHGHEVIVQRGAGHEIGFSDLEYKKAGAKVVNTAADVFKQAQLIVKVKEPQLEECKMLKKDQIIFSYLHLAAAPEITQALLKSKCTAIAYETVTDVYGRLPLLAPMSEIAGKLAVQAGAACLERTKGGRGVLLGGAPGVAKGKVVVLGGGAVGASAAQIALGMGAEVTLIEKSLNRIRELENHFRGEVSCIYSTVEAIEEYTKAADLLIGAVLIPGAVAPKLVPASLVKEMKRGAVIVDVAIDQGGCIATSTPTTHGEPTYVKHDIIHYCVANMPSAVARTSSKALENATLPYIINIADEGFDAALKHNLHLRAGLNIFQGKVTYKAVADTLGLSHYEPFSILG
jgi:alanine dehydrogenase